MRDRGGDGGVRAALDEVCGEGRRRRRRLVRRDGDVQGEQKRCEADREIEVYRVGCEG